MRLKPSLAGTLTAILAIALLAACTSPSARAPGKTPGTPGEAGPSTGPNAGQNPGPTPGQNPGPAAGSNPIVRTVLANVPPQPAATFILDVAFATPDHGWVLPGTQDAHGHLSPTQALETRDGGQTWHTAALPQPFDSISFTTPQFGYATAEQRPYRTTDGGETWAPLDTSGWPNPNATFLDEQHGWSWGPNQHLFRTQDGGNRWEPLSNPCPENIYGPFSFISPSTGWLLCGFGGGMGAMSKQLYKAEDGGLTWTLLGEALVPTAGDPTSGKQWPGGLDIGDYVGGLFFLDAQHGWFTGPRYGRFMATRDGGLTWQDVPASRMQGSRVRFVTPQVGYRVGMSTPEPWVVTMTRDGGSTWEQIYPRRQPLRRAYLDAQTYIGDLDGVLYRSDDAGATWRPLGTLPGSLLSLSYTSRENAWALMSTTLRGSLHLYRSRDGGSTWQPVAAADGQGVFQEVQGLDENTAAVWDGADRLLITRDGGKSFTPAAVPAAKSPRQSFVFTDRNTGWFARSYHLYTTADGGKSWKPFPLPEGWDIQGVTADPGGRVWATIWETYAPMQSRFTTVASDDGGKTWTRYDLGDYRQPLPIRRCGLSSLCVDDGGSRYSIVSHDSGQTWQYFVR